VIEEISLDLLEKMFIDKRFSWSPPFAFGHQFLTSDKGLDGALAEQIRRSLRPLGNRLQTAALLFFLANLTLNNAQESLIENEKRFNLVLVL
jgi:hypothetical protein